MKKIIRFVRPILLTLLLLLVLFFLVQKNTKTLIPNRISLVDNVENNYVFRGNNPFVIKGEKTIFAYEELTSHFNNILRQQGKKPLGDYYLIDVSLLDLDQFYLIKNEEQFFSNHPNQGEMINISTLSPILLLDQFLPSAAITQNASLHYNLWLNDTAKKIQNLALQQKDKPVVVYVHCDAGRDRTGLIVTAYRLLFKNMGLEATRSLDVKEVGRSSAEPYSTAARFFCGYVKQNYSKSENYCAYEPAPTH